MNTVTACFFLVLGVGLVGVAMQGLVRGWLPNGPNGLRQGEGVHRDTQPLAFGAFFLLYLAGGLALVFWALYLLILGR